MASTVRKNLTMPIGVKDPLYPLGVPVQIIYPSWVRHKEVIIRKETEFGRDSYFATVTKGPARGKQHALLADPPMEVLVDGEPWDFRIRA